MKTQCQRIIILAGLVSRLNKTKGKLSELVAQHIV